MIRHLNHQEELDHVFILCLIDAPEAGALANLGLREGSGNTHPGQGTACRRFFFQNAYLELLWVHDPVEAQNVAVRPTRLSERWSRRHEDACPFGIVLRPSRDAVAMNPQFATRPYTPSYLPSGFPIEIATNTPLTEPEFFYVGFQRGRARDGQEPLRHQIPVTDITDVTIGTPSAAPRSEAARATAAMGWLSFEQSDDYVLRLTFDRAIHRKSADCRPELPVVLQW